MGEIAFTQYKLPRGTRECVTIDRPDPIAKKAAELIASGCWFDIEILRSGAVSMTCERNVPCSNDPDDLEMEPRIVSIRIVPNGPEVPAAIDELVGDAWLLIRGE